MRDDETTDDVLDMIAKAINTMIETVTNQLIICEANRHDRLAGEIRGLSLALREVTKMAYKFRSGAQFGDAA